DQLGDDAAAARAGPVPWVGRVLVLRDVRRYGTDRHRRDPAVLAPAVFGCATRSAPIYLDAGGRPNALPSFTLICPAALPFTRSSRAVSTPRSRRAVMSCGTASPCRSKNFESTVTRAALPAISTRATPGRPCTG